MTGRCSVRYYRKRAAVRGNDLVHFLLRHRVIEAADVVERGLSIVDRERDRFVVRRIAIDGQPTTYIKQRVAPEAQPYLDAEIASLAYFSVTPALARTGPDKLASDAELGVVAMNALEGESAVALDDPAICEALAEVLGILHRETLAAPRRAPPPVGISSAPQIAGVLADPPTWQPSALQVVWPLVNNRARLKRAASEARRAWRSIALIHGDIKTEHCFVSRRTNGGVEVRVIDWELSGLGDPAWDVACALSEILMTASIPEAGGDAPMPDSAMRFLRAYATARKTGASTHAFHRRVTLYAGLRFFQSSLERAMVSSMGEASIRAYLNWSELILEAPENYTKRLQAALE